MANPISPFTGSLSVSLSGAVPYSNVVLGTKTTFSPGLSLNLPFQNATVTLPNVKFVQYSIQQETIAGSGNVVIDMTATFTNAAGAASASFATSIGAFIFFLPCSTDAKYTALGLTAQASSVTIGDAASNAWSDLLGATGTVTLKPGHALIFMDLSGTAPLAIGSSNKSLKVLNNDSVNSANLLTYFLGN